MRNIGKWLLLFLAVVVIAGGIGLYLWNKAPDKVEDVKGISVTATTLTQEYAQNEQAANQKYLNKALEVSGTISEINQNQDGATVVIMTGTDAPLAIQCTMRNKDIQLQSGQQVIIKGFCSGNTMFDVLLTDCVVK